MNENVKKIPEISRIVCHLKGEYLRKFTIVFKEYILVRITKLLHPGLRETLSLS